MTPEQKLNYLRDYMNMFIQMKIDKVYEADRFWRIWKECGIITATMLYNIPIPTFEYYLQHIENHEL